MLMQESLNGAKRQHTDHFLYNLWRISTAARSTVKACRAKPGQFLVAFPLGVVLANGYFFTVFLALQNRGSFRANNRAEYAKLERASLARGATTTTT